MGVDQLTGGGVGDDLAVDSLTINNRWRNELVDEIILDGDASPANEQVFSGLSNDALYSLYIEANADSGGKLIVQFNDDTADGNSNYEWRDMAGSSTTDDGIVLWSQNGVIPVRGRVVFGQSTQSGGAETPTLRNLSVGGRAGDVNAIGQWGAYSRGEDLDKIHVTMDGGWRSGQTHTLELWRVR